MKRQCIICGCFFKLSNAAQKSCIGECSKELSRLRAARARKKNREWRLEYGRQWALLNHEYKLQSGREWYQKNAERERDKRRADRKANPDKYRQYAREWAKKRKIAMKTVKELGLQL